jgi:hypothetical protein
VSKRHQSNRRKTYGRRQHEVYERQQRDRQSGSHEAGQDERVPGSLADRFAFLDSHVARLRYAAGD